VDSEHPSIPRILIVAGGNDLHAVVARALGPEKPGSFRDGVRRLAGNIFARPAAAEKFPQYDLLSCFALPEAVAEVSRAVAADKRFALIILALNMVPMAAAATIRKLDPQVNILLMLSEQRQNPADIVAGQPPPDKLFYLEKPFTPRAIKPLVRALTAKWRVERRLARVNLELAAARENLATALASRDAELRQTRRELAELRQGRQNNEEAFARQTGELEEAAVAMKVLLKSIALDDPGLDEKVMHRKIREMDEKIILNVKELTEPFLDKLGMTTLDGEQREYLAILRTNLEKIASPVMQRLNATDYGLSPAELQVANLIRQGKSSKSIAVILNLSVRTIDFHRDKIRKKLAVKNRRTSLKSVLDSFAGRHDGP
jgi:DNA-binding CsgD family transcriptional regulator/DNA-binding response OmpR family regulator